MRKSLGTLEVMGLGVNLNQGVFISDSCWGILSDKFSQNLGFRLGVSDETITRLSDLSVARSRVSKEND